MNRPRRSFDLLVFDWDGTLSDSLGAIVAAMQAGIADLGLEPRTPDAIRPLVGLGLDEVARRLFPDLSAAGVAALGEAYRTHWNAIPPDSIALFPGVAELLPELGARGYAVAIATGKSRRGLDRALGHSGLAGHVHASRCADETFSKPHPRMLQELIELFAAEAERTLMIGDSEHDLQMARNAGTGAAVMHCDRDSAGRLLEFKPLVCLPGYAELRRWLAQADEWMSHA